MNFYKILEYSKAIAAFAAGVLGVIVSLLPGAPQWLIILVAVLGFIAVYAIPNAPTTKQKEEILNQENLDF